MNFRKFCLDYLSKLPRKSIFLSIENYHNEHGEVANHLVGFHINYENSVKKSLQIWKDLRINFSMIRGKSYSLQDLCQAKTELINSYTLSLTPAGNPFYTCAGVYCSVLDCNQEIIPGIKLHKTDNILYLEGYRLAKRIIRAGAYPEINSCSLTLAKNWLRTQAPVGSWGQYQLTVGRFDGLKAGTEMSVKSGLF